MDSTYLQTVFTDCKFLRIMDSYALWIPTQTGFLRIILALCWK